MLQLVLAVVHQQVLAPGMEVMVANLMAPVQLEVFELRLERFEYVAMHVLLHKKVLQEGCYLTLHQMVEVREVSCGTCILMQFFHIRRRLYLLCVYFLVLLCILVLLCS